MMKKPVPDLACVVTKSTDTVCTLPFTKKERPAVAVIELLTKLMATFVLCAKEKVSPLAHVSDVDATEIVTRLARPCTITFPVSPITVPLFDMVTVFTAAPVIVKATRLSPLDETTDDVINTFSALTVPAKRKLAPVTEFVFSVAPTALIVSALPIPPT